MTGISSSIETDFSCLASLRTYGMAQSLSRCLLKAVGLYLIYVLKVLAVFLPATVPAYVYAAFPSLAERHIAQLPPSIVSRIASDSGMKVDDIRVYPGGNVAVGDVYVSAISFADSTASCSIYVLANGTAQSLFNGAPCTFNSRINSSYARGTEYPDLIFKIKLFLPSQGAMADEVVALYYDRNMRTYCESQSLSEWYQGGSKGITPNLADGRCVAEGR